MANAVTFKLLHDGQSTVSVQWIGTVDTVGDLALPVDPGVLSPMGDGRLATALAIEKVQGEISDGVTTLTLTFEGTPDLNGAIAVGRFKHDFKPAILNTATAKTGRVKLEVGAIGAVPPPAYLDITAQFRKTR